MRFANRVPFILLTESPDSVSNAKAIIKGWDTKQFKHIHALLKGGKITIRNTILHRVRLFV